MTYKIRYYGAHNKLLASENAYDAEDCARNIFTTIAIFDNIKIKRVEIIKEEM